MAYPISPVIWTDKIDYLDTVKAADVNQIYAETIAVEDDLINTIKPHLDGVDTQLADITKQTTSVDVANTFTLDLAVRKSFTVTIGNATAIIIAFSNIPVDLDFATPVVIKIICTSGNTISTYPAGVVWADGVIPVFTLGKTYYATFIRTSTGWHGMFVGAWS